MRFAALTTPYVLKAPLWRLIVCPPFVSVQQRGRWTLTSIKEGKSPGCAGGDGSRLTFLDHFSAYNHACRSSADDFGPTPRKRGWSERLDEMPYGWVESNKGPSFTPWFSAAPRGRHGSL